MRPGLFASVVLGGLLLGCSQRTGPVAPFDAGALADRNPIDAGCFNGYYPCPATELIAALQAVELGLAFATALTEPMISDGVQLDLDPTPEAQVRLRAEHGFSQGVVTPASCASFAWTGTNARVALDDCTLVATGAHVSGALTLGTAVHPASFHMLFTSLAVNSTVFEGEVVITVASADAAGVSPTVGVDCAYDTPIGRTHLTASHLLVRVAPGPTPAPILGVVGDATMTTDVASAGVTLGGPPGEPGTGLAWPTGQCLPAGGTIVLNGLGAMPTTFVFMGVTPYDGGVGVIVGSTVQGQYTAFAPCPAS